MADDDPKFPASATPSAPEGDPPEAPPASEPPPATARESAPAEPAREEPAGDEPARDEALAQDLAPGIARSDASAPAAAPRPLVRRHAAIVRICHALNVVLLFGLVASGLQIYGAYPRFGAKGTRLPLPNPFEGHPFPRWATLGGWLAGGLNWHFALAWAFLLTGLVYVAYLAFSGEWRSLLFRPRDTPRAVAMQLYYLRLRPEHPPQGKHNALQKLAYTAIVALGAFAVATGLALYRPVQLAPLTALLGGYDLVRWEHFAAVWAFVAFTVVHVALVLVVDPASLRAIVTGRYRGRFPSHD